MNNQPGHWLLLKGHITSENDQLFMSMLCKTGLLKVWYMLCFCRLWMKKMCKRQDGSIHSYQIHTTTYLLINILHADNAPSPCEGWSLARLDSLFKEHWTSKAQNKSFLSCHCLPSSNIAQNYSDLKHVNISTIYCATEN